MIAKISPGLKDLAYPIDKLKLLPGNPNKGNVRAVAALYDAVGQQKPIVARHEPNGDEIVIAGNTQLQAAMLLGWTHIATNWADELDDKQAITYALGDNKTADLGDTDKEAELLMLSTIDDDIDLLMAAGYDLADLQELQESVDIPIAIDSIELGPMTSVDSEEDDEEQETEVRSIGTPVIQYTIVFDNEEQQKEWFKFVKWLKFEAYPEQETLGSRLFEFLDENRFYD